MSHNSPSWWYDQDTSPPFILSPISYIYGKIVCYRWNNTKPYKSKLPVICIGNFTVGGAGKTPTALYVADLVKKLGHNPVFLSRGYGGKKKGPYIVSNRHDSSLDVGDEPLLLANSAPTVVCADRAKGAQFIEKLREISPSVIIMDDGFQNPSLYKDLSIVVIDGMGGIGNRRVFPSGPLRAPLSFQEKKADILLTIGEGTELEINIPNVLNISANLVPEQNNLNLREGSFIAYTGIARPEKFYATLKTLGVKISEAVPFPDHHHFTKEDVDHLLCKANDYGCKLVTTRKDIVRLSEKQEPFKTLRTSSIVVDVNLYLRNGDNDKLLDKLREKLF